MDSMENTKTPKGDREKSLKSNSSSNVKYMLMASFNLAIFLGCIRTCGFVNDSSMLKESVHEKFSSLIRSYSFHFVIKLLLN